MADDLVKFALALFTGIITVAIIAEFVGQKSQFPQAIQATSSALANVVSAAVNPVNTAATNGNLGLNSFSTPSMGTLDPGAAGLQNWGNSLLYGGPL